MLRLGEVTTAVVRMADDLVIARVRVAGPVDSDAAETDHLTRNLRDELLQTDVEEVRQQSAGPAPDGSKAGEVLQVGALLVAVAPIAVQAVVDAVRRWQDRQRGASVTITIDGDTLELDRATPEVQEELLKAFLGRHGSVEG